MNVCIKNTKKPQICSNCWGKLEGNDPIYPDLCLMCSSEWDSPEVDQARWTKKEEMKDEERNRGLKFFHD